MKWTDLPILIAGCVVIGAACALIGAPPLTGGVLGGVWGFGYTSWRLGLFD